MADSIWSRRTNEKSSFLASAGVKNPDSVESETGMEVTENKDINHHIDNDELSKNSEDEKSSDQEGNGIGQHILPGSWTVWFLYRGPGVKISNYLLATKQVGDFSTVEEFWHVYLHLKRVNELPFTSEFQIFRQGVKPLWEDPVNVNGGKWVVRFKRSLKTKKAEDQIELGGGSGGGGISTGVDSAGMGTSDLSSVKYNQVRQQTTIKWERLLLAIIGGTLTEEVAQDEVVGIVVSARRDEDIISVWTKSGNDTDSGNKVKEAIKAVLDLKHDGRIEFKIHTDSLKEGVKRMALSAGERNEKSDRLIQDRDSKYEKRDRYDRHDRHDRHDRYDRHDRPSERYERHEKHGHHSYGNNPHYRPHHSHQQKPQKLSQQLPEHQQPPFGIKGVLDQAIAQSMPSTFLSESIISRPKSNDASQAHLVDKW